MLECGGGSGSDVPTADSDSGDEASTAASLTWPNRFTRSFSHVRSATLQQDGRAGQVSNGDDTPEGAECGGGGGSGSGSDVSTIVQVDGIGVAVILPVAPRVLARHEDKSGAAGRE